MSERRIEAAEASLRAVPATGDANPSRVVVGIGEVAVSDRLGCSLSTHALGSCIAVCIWDPEVRVAGLLHFLLPDASINPERAERQPATFADVGIPLLFTKAYSMGLDKRRARVWLIGGAEAAGMSGQGSLNIGKRNLLAAKNILWRNGVMIQKEDTGGTEARSVTLSVADGILEVSKGRLVIRL